MSNSYIDDILFDTDGFLKPVSSKVIRNIPFNDYRLWCHYNSVYGYPTLELVEYLKKEIDGQNAIEIGSGNGSLAKALGIIATDNKCQEYPDVINSYKLMQQPLIKYGENVKKIDALDAVKKYQPDVVIGMWVTHRWMQKDAWRSGNMYGIQEKQIVKRCKYILIGNDEIHKNKRIWTKPYKKEYFDWLISRKEQNNYIATWECQSKLLKNKRR